MTDRELLELAAKAEGHDVAFDEVSGLTLLDANSCVLWNPLHNDGDALRLAVKLNLNVHVDCQALPPSIIVENNTSQDPKYISAEEKGGALGTNLDLRLAATRRAITRAAAEIGRSMK